MLPNSSSDFKYYTFLSLGLSIIIITISLLLNWYLTTMLNTSLFNVAFLEYVYILFRDLHIEVLTFWILASCLVSIVVLSKLIVVKNPFVLTKKYSSFASWLTIKKMKPNILQQDGFLLGIFKNKELKTNEPLSLLCVAPAGAGKTTGTVIPTILSCDKDSLVINDPKGELYEATAKYRKQLGKVFKIEWKQDKANWNEETVFWNPLSLDNLPSSTAERGNYVDMICAILVQESKGDSFWSQSARKTLSAMMLFFIYLKETQHQDTQYQDTQYQDTSIAEVKDALDTIGITDQEAEQSNKTGANLGFALLAEQVQNMDLPLSIKERCLNVFASNSANSENTLGSILATISTALMVFNNENVRDITTKNSFNIKNIRGITSNNQLKPVTVYLISPASEQELFGVLSGIFVEATYKYITSQEMNIVKQSNIVRFILDEVAFFPKISAISDGAAIARGYKGSFLLVCQDVAQIKERYGENGLNNMMTNTAFKIILTQNNFETARRFALISGKSLKIEWESQGKARKKIKKEVNLIEPTDLMDLPTGKQIVIVQNNAKSPIICNIPFYFKNKTLVKKLKIAKK